MGTCWRGLTRNTLRNNFFVTSGGPGPSVGVEDTMTPAEDALHAYQRALEPKKLLTVPGTHYAVYDEQFARTSSAARDWFVEHLGAGA